MSFKCDYGLEWTSYEVGSCSGVCRCEEGRVGVVALLSGTICPTSKISSKKYVDVYEGGKTVLVVWVMDDVF